MTRYFGMDCVDVGAPWAHEFEKVSSCSIQRQHLKIQNHGDSSFPCFSHPVLVPHGSASNCARLGNWNPARAPALTTDVRLAGLEIYWNDAV